MFHIMGKVERGLGEARKIGFPTLNISYTLPHGQSLAVGVYAAEVRADGRVYQAAACVGADWGAGQRPKFEVYLFDAGGSEIWYDKEVEVKVLKKIRDLTRFDNAEEACARIAQDVEDIKNFFAD
ncbi:MAG: riboflavin kinase [Candidatus Magasanikbacteria bacterium]|nr:riboflavin kinase [Candidatus Magasanikbacteria bacterium]